MSVAMIAGTGAALILANLLLLVILLRARRRLPVELQQRIDLFHRDRN